MGARSAGTFARTLTPRSPRGEVHRRPDVSRACSTGDHPLDHPARRRSPHPPRLRPGGFTVVDYRDIPGRNYRRADRDDQPCLAEHEVYHVAEPILLLAHADRERLSDATARVDRLHAAAGVFDPERSTASRRSRSTRAISTAASPAPTSSSRASTGPAHQEQLYIETNGVIAVPERRRHDGLRLAAVPVLRAQGARRCCSACRADRVRVVQTETGGGFGGKEEYPSHTRLPRGAARAQGGAAGEDDLRPRRGHARDDQAASVDRAASHRRDARRPLVGDGHRRRDGRRRVLHAEPRRAVARRDPRVGPVPLRHVRIRGRAMRTNTPPNGAFRGFGAPQTQFAAEVHMDRIAEALGLDPVSCAS